MDTILSFFADEKIIYGALKGRSTLIEDSLPIQESSQSAALVPFLSSLWKKIDYAPLTQIICSRGPGAFTTLRITLSAAQGLKMAFPNAQIYAPSTFKILAFSSEAPQGIALIDSHKGYFYGCEFEGKKLGDPSLWDDDRIQKSGETFVCLHPPKDSVLKVKDKLILPLGNLASSMIELYESEKDQIKPEDQELFPFYIQSPIYRKRKQPLADFLDLKDKLKFKLDNG